MKIKLIRTPRPGQPDMVFQTQLGTYSVEMGGSVELTDEEASVAMGRWPGCFAKQDEKTEEEAPVKSVEKAAEEEADEEAAKMVKGYKNKKLHTEG